MKKTTKKEKITKEKPEPLFFYNFKKKFFVLLHQKADKSQFILLSGKNDSNIKFNKRGRKVSFDSGDFSVDFSKAKNFHITEFNKELILNFIENEQTFFAFSKDGVGWKVKGKISNVVEDGCLSPCKTADGKFAFFYGNKDIKIAYSADFKNWKIDENTLLSPRIGLFDKNDLRVVGTYLFEKGIGLVYESNSHTNSQKTLQTSYVLLAKDNPSKIIWRADSPLTENTLAAGVLAKVHCLGMIFNDGIFYIYYNFENKIFAISGRDPFSAPVHKTLKLERPDKNPIIWPKEISKWQSIGTFNPGALYLDGKVHLVYRAVGEDWVSNVGYAMLGDGIHVENQSEKPIYFPKSISEKEKHEKLPMVVYESGPGGYGGIEDPRLIKIGEIIYMIYVAFNGYEAPRVALTSISERDFLSKSWNWQKPVFLSKKGMTQKNWVLFPEKINGKFALLVSLSPEVQIFYFDKLPKSNLELEGNFKNKPGIRRWDNLMRGAGAPPIRTEHGWLILYHAMDVHDPNKYKVGAMILDYKNPEKILYRSANPILEPDKGYENEGYKAGVVYVCGAVVVDKTLFVYYGGADTVVCVATISFDEFLKSLTKETQKEMGHHTVLL